MEYKQAEAEADKIREEILQAFEKQHILSWESPNKKVKVTYVHKTDVESVDKAKLKKDFPTVYNKVIKLTSRKAYIKIETKGEQK